MEGDRGNGDKGPLVQRMGGVGVAGYVTVVAVEVVVVIAPLWIMVEWRGASP